MQNLKTEIAEKIKINRPKLSASSLKTYVSILFNIHKAMKIEDTNIDFFSDKIKDILE